MSAPTSILQAKSVLATYVSALEDRDIQTLESLVCDHTLVEIPFLKPNRLVGRREISNAHRAMFETLQDLSFKMGEVADNDGFAIAEGELRSTRASGEQHTHHIAIVVEVRGTTLHRLSLYGDARNIRLWSDKTIL